MEEPDVNGVTVAGWWFAKGMWFSPAWTLAGIPKGEKLSIFIEMGFVGEVEIVHYAPHVATGLEAVRTVMEDDTEGLRSDLEVYLAHVVLETRSRTDSFNLTPESEYIAPGAGRFYLWEIVRDIEAAKSSGFSTYCPSTPSKLKLSPIIPCDCQGGHLTFLDGSEHFGLNFAPGMELVVESPATGKQRATIVTAAPNAIVVYDGDDLAFGQCYITEVVVPDPVRTINVNEFCAWRKGVQSLAPQGDVDERFNDALYRLLYSPIDPAVASMSSAELYKNYESNSDRVSSVVDLIAAVRSAPDEILKSLRVMAGASIEFATGQTIRTVGGLTTLNDVRYGVSTGPEDTLIPTTAAVRELISESETERGGDGDQTATFLSTVDDPNRNPEEFERRTLHAARACFGSLDVTDAVSSDRVQCKTLDVRDSFTADSSAVHISARTTSVNDIRADGVTCSTLVGRTSTVSRLDASSVLVENVSTDTIDVLSHMNANSVRCVDLELAGEDIATQIRDMRELIRSADDRVRALEESLERVRVSQTA